jgi:hypothetical protein
MDRGICRRLPQYRFNLVFDMKSLSMHCWMTVMLATLLGLLIFMLGALDNPFRGDISVGSEPFELVYQRRMGPEPTPPSAQPTP